MKRTKPKHTSMARVSRTGEPAPSWTFDEEVTALANKCFMACLNPLAKPDLIRVYRNSSTYALGRCFIEQRIITIRRKHKDWLHTLAHEIAHLRVSAHCPKHDRLTEELYAWLINETEAK